MLNLIASADRNECNQYHHQAMGSLQYLCLMLFDSQGPPCGQRREMRPSWCRWGSPSCCSAGPLQGCPLLSSSGWITVSHLHVHTSAHVQGHFTTNTTTADKQRRRELMENRPLRQRRLALNQTCFSHIDISNSFFFIFFRFPEATAGSTSVPGSERRLVLLECPPRRQQAGLHLLRSLPSHTNHPAEAANLSDCAGQ